MTDSEAGAAVAMQPYYSDDHVTLYHADVLDGLAAIPDGSVHCCVTSPPYWGLRDYGSPDQLGLEPTPEEYVAKMVAVFREVRRVLRDDGVCWLNLGDSYSGAGYSNHANTGGTQREDGGKQKHLLCGMTGLKPKDLVGIPWRVAFALQADGWWLRQDIIWAKPNPMPESVTDRCTKAHEYVFLLTKSARYFYDAEAVCEPATHAHEIRWDNGEDGHGGGESHKGQGSSTRKFKKQDGHGRRHEGFNARYFDGTPAPVTRNLRSVWTISTKPYPGAHFAVFPPELPERCIKAGTSEKGCCPECGAPWERVVEREHNGATRGRRPDPGMACPSGKAEGSNTRGMPYVPVETIGWQPTCTHDATPEPCTVLDPFAGAGTTLWRAKELGRKAIGVELSETYCKLILPRIAQGVLAL